MNASEIVKNNPCPPIIGRHGWLWQVACLCRDAAVPQKEAENAIRKGLSRPETGSFEVSDTVTNAYLKSGGTDPTVVLQDGTAIRKSDIKYDSDALAQAVHDVPSLDLDFFAARSAPLDTNPVDLLFWLAQSEGEHILAFDRMDSKLPALVARRTAGGLELAQPERNKAGCEWQVLTETEEVRAALIREPWPLGFWWLPQPVDGKWSGLATSPEKLSCRSSHNVLSFRWMVLESDEAPSDLWLRFLATVPGVGLITTSGGKSIHALVRVDQPSVEMYNRLVDRYRWRFIRLGADRLSLSAVRLTRLPGCFRNEKKLKQNLLYWNPDVKTGGPPIWSL